jgi:hypothetical protein
MAIILEAAYSKKLGLPNFSSHSYVVSIRTELSDIKQVPEESSKLYRMLQDAVDTDIAVVGFMPDATKYGMNGSQPSHGNGHRRDNSAGISDKQLDLINRVIKENNANKAETEQLAVSMFGGGIRTLNRMQASNFIDALFEKYPRNNRQDARRPARSL